MANLKKSKSCLEMGRILKRLLDQAINYTARFFVYLSILRNIFMYSAITFFNTVKIHKLLQILMQNQQVSSL